MSDDALEDSDGILCEFYVCLAVVEGYIKEQKRKKNYGNS